MMKSEGIDPAKKVQGKLKEIFVSGGFQEAINFSFEDYELLTLFGKTEALGILNPISSEGSVMRTSLLPGLIRNTVLNLNRQEQDVRLFEIGKIFIPCREGQASRRDNEISCGCNRKKTAGTMGQGGIRFL